VDLHVQLPLGENGETLLAGGNGQATVDGTLEDAKDAGAGAGTCQADVQERLEGAGTLLPVVS